MVSLRSNAIWHKAWQHVHCEQNLHLAGSFLSTPLLLDQQSVNLLTSCWRFVPLDRTIEPGLSQEGTESIQARFPFDLPAENPSKQGIQWFVLFQKSCFFKTSSLFHRVNVSAVHRPCCFSCHLVYHINSIDKEGGSHRSGLLLGILSSCVGCGVSRFEDGRNFSQLSSILCNMNLITTEPAKNTLQAASKSYQQFVWWTMVHFLN